MIDCPACGHPNIEGAEQCEQCQADLSDMGVPESSAEGLAARLLKESVMELKPDRGLTMLPENTVSEVTQAMIDHARSVVPRVLTPCERKRFFLPVEGEVGDCPN